MTGTLCSHTFFIPKFESHLVITVLRCSCLGSASFNMTEPLCPLFFRRCCRTDRHMARGDTFCQSISPPQVHLFLAGLVRVGIKLLTQDRPDALDNLYHSSIAPVVCHYRSRLYINREMPSASSLFWSKISLSKKHLTSPLLLESQAAGERSLSWGWNASQEFNEKAFNSRRSFSAFHFLLLTSASRTSSSSSDKTRDQGFACCEDSRQGNYSSDVIKWQRLFPPE